MLHRRLGEGEVREFAGGLQLVVGSHEVSHAQLGRPQLDLGLGANFHGRMIILITLLVSPK